MYQGGSPLIEEHHPHIHASIGSIERCNMLHRSIESHKVNWEVNQGDSHVIHTHRGIQGDTG